MVYYRLCQDHDGLMEGAVVSEETYRTMFYLSRPLYDYVDDWELENLIRYDPEQKEDGVLFYLFYSNQELDNFLNKQYERNIID